jgi:apolipoprotein N-acyltransferase
VKTPVSRWLAGAGLLAVGVAHTAAFAPLGWWPLQILSLAVLAWALAGAPPRRAAWLAGCFSFGWLSSGLWWLHISMHDFGEMPAVLSITAVGLLAAFLSLYPALAMAWWARHRSGRPLPDGLRFAGLWLAAELARAQWFTGFPWIASGYAHTDGLLAALAPWVGVYGMGAVAALLAAALAALPRHGRSALPLLALAAAGPLAALLAPSDFTMPTGALSVSLLQPNVAQDVKFDPDHIVDNMRTLQQQLHAARGSLVVTPESVLPLARDQLDAGYWQGLTAPFRQGRQAALIGTFLGNDADGYVNSLVGVQPGAGEDYAYGKRHLLPFGEFVPFGFRWFVDLMHIPLGDQASGRSTAAFEVGGQRVRPLICYEDLFGEDFAASMLGPDAATVLVNASNLAWFGRQMIQAQHLQFSRMRALEFQRPLARATNTGATAVVDHQGRVTAALPAWTVGTLDATVQGRVGATPYARWVSRWQLWPLWALAVLAAWPLWPRRWGPVPRAR